MSDAEMDRILSRKDEIPPSSGFTASVMDAVRAEAAAPPPIPFPWKRALPVLLVAGAVLSFVVVAGVAVIVEVAKGTVSLGATPSLPSISDWAQGGTASAVRWTVMALLSAYVSVKVSMKLASGGS